MAKEGVSGFADFLAELAVVLYRYVVELNVLINLDITKLFIQCYTRLEGDQLYMAVFF